jgi:hypothetical protein
MVDAVECRRQVRVKYPCAARVLPLSRLIDSLDRVMAATARPESIGSRFEPCFPLGFQRVDGQSLKTSVGNHGNSELALSPIGFPDVHTLDGVWSPRVGPVLQPVDQVSPGLWQQRDLTVDPGRRAPSVDLRYSPDADLRVGVGAEHQLLQIPDFCQVSCLRCREDSLPQTSYVLLGLSPINRRPVQEFVVRSVHHNEARASTSAASVDIVMASNLPFGSGVVSQCCFTGSPDPRQHPFRSGISPYPASYVGQTDGGRP